MFTFFNVNIPSYFPQFTPFVNNEQRTMIKSIYLPAPNNVHYDEIVGIIISTCILKICINMPNLLTFLCRL